MYCFLVLVSTNQIIFLYTCQILHIFTLFQWNTLFFFLEKQTHSSEDWMTRKTIDEEEVVESKRIAQELLESGGGSKKKKGEVEDFSTGIEIGEDPGSNGDFRSWKKIVRSFVLFLIFFNIFFTS